MSGLSGPDEAVLLVLMACAGPVPNARLRELGPALGPAARERLNRAGLVESTRVAGRITHELTDRGWRHCRDRLGAGAPDRSAPQGRALYTVLAALGRHLDRTGMSLADVFGAPDTPAEPDIPAEPDTPAEPRPGSGAQQADSDPQQQVRLAYHQLAGQPGAWVALRDLRRRLPDLTRADLDDALVRLYQHPGVHLIPEENQKVLTQADRDAAVMIGDQHKHLIAVTP